MTESCEDRIQKHLDSRIEDFAAFYELQHDAATASKKSIEVGSALGIEFEETWRENPYDIEDQAWEIVREYPLWISQTKKLKIDLSTGGPGDWLEIESDTEGVFDANSRITYHFNDWFDHAEIELHGEEYDAAWQFISNFLEQEF